MKMRYLFSLLFLFVSVVPIAFASGDPAAGRIKAEPCMGCHAVEGYFSVYPSYRVPRVGGQHPEYIIAALKEYKAKQRSHATMRAQAATLSEQDMADIAAYFSSFKGD